MSGTSRLRFVFPLLIVWVAGILVYVLWPEGEITHEPGVLVSDEPHQRPAVNVAPWEKDGYQITPLAEFDACARVLHIKHYSRGRESDLSPEDLALGWGAMSDTRVLDQIEITQRDRWYEWHVRTFPIPRRSIETSSANMHIIPADDPVDDVLGSLKRGNVIRFSGYLVEVAAKDGWKWRSSLTRDDVGQGACEVVWVNKISVLP